MHTHIYTHNAHTQAAARKTFLHWECKKHSRVYADGKFVVPSFFSALTMERKSNESTPCQDGGQETSWLRRWEGLSEPSLRHCWVGNSEVWPSLLQPVTWLPPVSKHWLVRPQNLRLPQAEAHGRLLNHADLSAAFPEPPVKHPFCLALDPPPILNACTCIFPGPWLLLRPCQISSQREVPVCSKDLFLRCVLKAEVPVAHLASNFQRSPEPGLQALLSLGPHLSYPAWPWLLRRLFPSLIAA